MSRPRAGLSGAARAAESEGRTDASLKAREARNVSNATTDAGGGVIDAGSPGRNRSRDNASLPLVTITPYLCELL